MCTLENNFVTDLHLKCTQQLFPHSAARLRCFRRDIAKRRGHAKLLLLLVNRITIKFCREEALL